MYYIGVDLGTSAVKLLLMDGDGKVKKTVSKRYAESNPNEWWKSTVVGLKEMTFASALADLVIIEEFVYRLDIVKKEYLLLNTLHNFFPLVVGIAMTGIAISMLIRLLKYRA